MLTQNRKVGDTHQLQWQDNIEERRMIVDAAADVARRCRHFSSRHRMAKRATDSTHSCDFSTVYYSSVCLYRKLDVVMRRRRSLSRCCGTTLARSNLRVQTHTHTGRCRKESACTNNMDEYWLADGIGNGGRRSRSLSARADYKAYSCMNVRRVLLLNPGPLIYHIANVITGLNDFARDYWCRNCVNIVYLQFLVF